eukprot:11975983-Alexandrium_andersonii.AAC.1
MCIRDRPSTVLEIADVAATPGEAGSGVKEGNLSASAPLKPHVVAGLPGFVPVSLRFAPHHAVAPATPKLRSPGLP